MLPSGHSTQPNNVNEKGTQKGMAWQTFALMTVLFWGVYGVLLHTGRMGMMDSVAGKADAANASMKAFLLVGFAYFVVAIVGPLIVLMQNKSNWSFSGKGLSWSFLAGTAGAIGAFTLILALGAANKAGSSPAAVMSIVFGGAPIVNAIVALTLHPPEGGIKAIPLPFFLGIAMAACGGFLVAKFSPSNAAAKKPVSAEVKH
jgi:hypothetical protein